MLHDTDMNRDTVYFCDKKSKVPRVIAATIKTKESTTEDYDRPRISGDLIIVDKSRRYTRYAEIRDGRLLVYRHTGKNKAQDFCISLYNLSINLDTSKHRNNYFSLSKFGDVTPLVTFQVVQEHEYNNWLKALAVEIIKQTPLNTLKFMDILFVNELIRKRNNKRANARTATCIKSSSSFGKDRVDVDPANIPDRDRNNVDRENMGPIDYEPNLKFNLDTFAANYYCWHRVREEKSNDSFDSGFDSLQCPSSGNGKFGSSDISESFANETNTTKVRKISNFKSNVSSLIKKFKKPSSNEITTTRDTSVANDALCTTTKSGKFKYSSLSNHLQNEQNQHFESLKNPREFARIELRKSVRNANEQRRNVFLKDDIHFRRYCDDDDDDDDDKSLQKLDLNVRRPCEKPEPYAVNYQHLVTGSSTDSLAFRSVQNVDAYLPEELLRNENADVLLRLLTKCQIDREEYVTVREKRILFESLSKFSFSVDNLRKRSRYDDLKYDSMYDLRTSSIPVKILKRYFERFDEYPSITKIT